jgi:ABC-type Fe3+/spermidine/putrescine transport system ATPase subunit
MTENMLTIRRLTKRFGVHRAVDAMDLDVRQGEIIALLGPSGCGKTTTLRMVAGLEEPSEGDIHFGDRALVSTEQGIDLPPEKRNVGMVFQSYALWPHMTASENIAYPLKLRGVARAEIQQRVERVLDLIELPHLANQAIPKLSGGQQQRIALARALVYEPAIMLFDEPFSNLDTQLREQMRLELKILRRKVTMTGIFVTHDQAEALSLADRVAIMRDGHVEQVGEPHEVYRNPATPFVRDFLGRAIKLRGVVEQRGGATAVRLGTEGEVVSVTKIHADGVNAGDKVEVSIRPEYIELLVGDEDGPPNSLKATIKDLLFTGERYEARMQVADDVILFSLPSNRDWTEGQSLRLSLPADALSMWPDRDAAP